MRFKQTALVASLAAAFSFGVSQQANAYVYAASALEITNLTVVISGVSGGGITGFQERATNTATLNGVSATTGTGGTGAGLNQLSISCSGLPGTPGAATNNCNDPAPRLDPGAANAPGGVPVRSNNDFTLFGTGTQFSNADSVIYTSELTLDASTHTQQIAESNLTSGSGANANSEITSTTGFNLTFAVTDGGGLVLDFFADPYERSAINATNLLTANSQPNMSVTFTLQNLDSGQQIKWQPDGTATNNCTGTISNSTTGTTCTENADASDLQHQIPNSFNLTDFLFDPASGEFKITIAGLPSGHYSLGLDALTSTDVSQRLVPEPGVLALLGIGLVGAFATTRRRKSK